MARRGTLRASDQDREQVAERLRQAAVDGRLLAEELEHRLARALRARTYGELDPLVADLPGRRAVSRRRHQVHPVAGVAAAAVVAVLVVAALAVAALVITGLLFAWGVWVFLAWWLFGHARHRHRPQVRVVHRRSLL